jgi:hypothetical protein
MRRVTLYEPDGGWSGEAYARALNSYALAHGRSPQTATMHPDTARALGLSEELILSAAGIHAPLLVVSPDFDRETITLYY